MLLIAPVGAKAGLVTLSGDLTADNAFFAYLGTSNTTLGTLLTQGNSWSTTFSFTNIALTPGQTYYVQIEAINYGGPGAFLGQFTLSGSGFHFSNGTQSLLTNTSNWQAVYNDSNSNPNLQQPWVTPSGGVISSGSNGVSPWGSRSGISASAQWIDGATNGLSACGNCTVDFSTTITAATPEPGNFAMLAGVLGAAALRVRRARAPAFISQLITPARR
jgi:hypothetical protein